METKQAVRIQTSILNAAEKKVLVWLAERQPEWVTSDLLTAIGSIGAVIIAVGYLLSGWNIAFLWLASFGFFVNWYGDSLDGTLARVRNRQRPVYGFFIDHNVDCINEAFMFIGAGLSPFMNLEIAMLLLVAYLMLSVYAYISAHLKGEFRLTYGKLGPTELRIIAVTVNTLFFFIEPLRSYSRHFSAMGFEISLGILDYVGLFIFAGIITIYVIYLVKDAREYAAKEPLKKRD